MEKLNSASVYFWSFDLTAKPVVYAGWELAPSEAEHGPPGAALDTAFSNLQPSVAWKMPQATRLFPLSSPSREILEGDLLSRINNILCCLCHSQ